MLLPGIGWYLVRGLLTEADSILILLYSDPPRPESEGAVMESLRAGIVVRMLTGDHVC